MTLNINFFAMMNGVGAYQLFNAPTYQYLEGLTTGGDGGNTSESYALRQTGFNPDTLPSATDKYLMKNGNFCVIPFDSTINMEYTTTRPSVENTLTYTGDASATDCIYIQTEYSRFENCGVNVICIATNKTSSPVSINSLLLFGNNTGSYSAVNLTSFNPNWEKDEGAGGAKPVLLGGINLSSPVEIPVNGTKQFVYTIKGLQYGKPSATATYFLNNASDQ